MLGAIVSGKQGVAERTNTGSASGASAGPGVGTRRWCLQTLKRKTGHLMSTIVPPATGCDVTTMRVEYAVPVPKVAATRK